MRRSLGRETTVVVLAVVSVRLSGSQELDLAPWHTMGGFGRSGAVGLSGPVA
jgi:hypothetical protein